MSNPERVSSAELSDVVYTIVRSARTCPSASRASAANWTWRPSVWKVTVALAGDVITTAATGTGCAASPLQHKATGSATKSTGRGRQSEISHGSWDNSTTVGCRRPSRSTSLMQQDSFPLFHKRPRRTEGLTQRLALCVAKFDKEYTSARPMLGDLEQLHQPGEPRAARDAGVMSASDISISDVTMICPGGIEYRPPTRTCGRCHSRTLQGNLPAADSISQSFDELHDPRLAGLGPAMRTQRRSIADQPEVPEGIDEPSLAVGSPGIA